MSQQAVTPFHAAQVPETLQDLLKKDSYRNRFEQVLGARAPQFISSILSLGTRLKGVEPRSVLASAAIAASLDLPIDPNLGFAWIVPYKKNGVLYGQFQLGYKGIIQLAQRTAAYKTLNAACINAEAYKGRDEVGEPIIDWEAVDEEKPVAGYVFSFRMINGFTKVCYWSKKKVEAHAKRYSQSYRGGYDSPWKDNFDMMALKTVVANELKRWGMLSVEVQGAFAQDNAIKKDIDAPAEFPEPADELSRPMIDAGTSTANEEANAQAIACLAPTQPTTPAPATETKAEQSRRVRAEAAAARQQQQAPKPAPPAAAPAPSFSDPEPEPEPEQPQLLQPVQDPQHPQQMVPGPATPTTPYDAAVAVMARDGINEAELMVLLKRKGFTAPTTEQLAQVADAVLSEMVQPENWAKVSAQIRMDRKKPKK